MAATSGGDGESTALLLLPHLPDESDWSPPASTDSSGSRRSCPPGANSCQPLLPDPAALLRSTPSGLQQLCEEELHGHSKLFRVTSVSEQEVTRWPPAGCMVVPPQGGAAVALQPAPLTNGLSTHDEEEEEEGEGEGLALLPEVDRPPGGSPSKAPPPCQPVPLLWLPGIDPADDSAPSLDSCYRDSIARGLDCDRLPSLTLPSGCGSASQPASAATLAAAKVALKERRPSITFAPTSVIAFEPADDEPAVSIVGSGFRGVHYRKQQKERLRRSSIDCGGSSVCSDDLAAPERRGREQSLLLPSPGASEGIGRRQLSPPRSPTGRNISTLSLTMLLRDQRRKNLAMLARLFATRQREKDMLEGVPSTNDIVTADVSKQRRCRQHLGTMEISMCILFCIIVSLVTSSLILFDPKRSDAFHKRQGFTLDKDKALLTVFDGRGREIKIRIGVGATGPRYSCLTEASVRDSTSPLQPNCVRWLAEKASLDVELSAADDTITCVDVHWTWHEALPPSSTVTDCIDIREAAWFGGADSAVLPWALNSAGPTGRLFYSAGTPDVGPIAEKLWLSDRGHLIAEVGNSGGGSQGRAATSLYVEVTDRGGNLCLSDSPSYRQRYGAGKRLTYVACVARDAGTAHRWVMQKRLNASTASSGGGVSSASDDGDEAGDQVGDQAGDVSAEAAPAAPSSPPPPPLPVSDVLKADPIWTLPENGTADHVRRIVQHRFGHSALLLEDNVLLMSVDDVAGRLAAASGALLEANGTRAAVASFGLTVSPAIGLSSELALGRLHEPWWFSSAPDELPLLMHHSATSQASVLLNLSKPLAKRFVVDKLTAPAVVAAYRVALVQLADAAAVSVMVLEHHGEVRPESVAEFSRSYLGLRDDLARLGRRFDYRVDGGPVPPPSADPLVYAFPLAIRRRPACGVLAHLLAASVAGHGAIDVGPFDEASSANGTAEERRRAYVSWLQLAAVSSAVHFGLPPWFADEHQADTTVRLAHRLLELRRTVILPRLRSALLAHTADGSPVYRPLWWDGAVAAAPFATGPGGSRKATLAAAAAASQFFVDDVLFAPTCDGKRQRTVFIPKGYWQDASGDVFAGPDIFTYSSMDSALPYFVHRPVGTM